MKTKTLLLICLFSGIGLALLNAQDYPTGPKNGKNGTVVWDFVIPWMVQIPVICDGLLIDQLSTPFGVTIKVVDHYKNGELIREFSMSNNILLTSDITGEVFIEHSWLSKYMIGEGLYYDRINVKGNMGNHYIIHTIWDSLTWEIVEISANCH